MAPLAPARFEFRATIDEQTLAELRAAAELLSHVIRDRQRLMICAGTRPASRVDPEQHGGNPAVTYPVLMRVIAR